MGNYIIIGGSSGIGNEITKKLVEEHSVYVFSRHAEEKDLPAKAIVKNLDILQEDISDYIPEEIDGLIYCPGSINLKPFRSLKEQDFINDYQINVLGAVRAIKSSLRGLKKSGNGSILLFSTVAVAQGMTFHSSISAAKGAVEGLTRSLAAEFAPSIRVNAIAPSLIETPLSNKLLSNEKMQEAAKSRHPLKRYGNPEDVADLAMFLIGPSSKFVTGQIYGIDGGLSAVR